MRMLHTADWHLGVRLVERERLEEHAVFLDWLLEVMVAEQVEVLLVSGDVFDAATPPQPAVTLYYDFLRRFTALGGMRAVITGGNHDSASHLNAPRGLLEGLGVRVFGEAASTPEGAWVDLGGALVAAVPFLRERDLRRSVGGETSGEVQEQVKRAIGEHYAGVLAAGQGVAKGRPLVAMGHLTAMGATTSESERDIHIGNLGAVAADIFDGYDYVALGHLHRPQKVGGRETVRYSGSPLALSFAEAGDAKSVVIYDSGTGQTERVAVPKTRELVRAVVELEALESGLKAALPAGCWAEVRVKLLQPEADLDRRVREAMAGHCEVLKVGMELPQEARPPWQQAGPKLTELRPPQVFEELLQARGAMDEREELKATFQELLGIEEALRTA